MSSPPRQLNLTWLVIVALLGIVVVVNLNLPRRHKLPVPKFKLASLARITRISSHRQDLADRKLLASLKMGKAETELVTAMQAYNRAEYRSERHPKKSTLDAERKTIMRLSSQYIARYGIEQFIAIGLHMRRHLLQALTAFRRDTRKHRRSLLQQLRLKSDARDAVIRWGGSFLLFIMRAQLIALNGEMAVGSTKLLRVLHKYQWLLFASQTEMIETHLSNYERRLFLRWKIEVNPVNTLKSKLIAVARLRQIDPQFPADRVIGVLYAQRKMWERAAVYFWRAFAHDPSDFQTIRYLDYVTNPSNF